MSQDEQEKRGEVTYIKSTASRHVSFKPFGDVPHKYNTDQDSSTLSDDSSHTNIDYVNSQRTSSQGKKFH